jgi:hypothetical protein
LGEDPLRGREAVRVRASEDGRVAPDEFGGIANVVELGVFQRVIAAHQQPDHATIARFVERHERALAGLFGEVLTLCADAGLATVGVIAIDGTKVSANANRDRTMSYEQIAQEIVTEAIETDTAERARHGALRGDELPRSSRPRRAGAGGCGRPPSVWTSSAPSRPGRSPATATAAARVPPSPRGRPRHRAPRQRALRGLSSTRGYEGRPALRFAVEALHAATDPTGQDQPSDPRLKLVHAMRGWTQGYNAQAVCNEQDVILAADVMTASPDFGHLVPMVDAARHELTAAGVNNAPEVIVADAGYWHLEQMNEITGRGIPVLIPPDSSRRKNARPGWTGGAYDFMSRVLATERGAALYKQRAQLIEPIFGNTKHNRAFTRFARRGRAAARTEWRLMATTHNLLKLHYHFTAAA